MGIGSRRKCDELVGAGRVRVDGEIASLGCTVDPGRQVVTVDGRAIEAPGEWVYVVLNKPAGYLVTRRDERGRRTVFDLVQGPGERLFSVGRLDYDTEGVLLLTTDGELCWRLTHPRYEVDKIYEVLVEGIPTGDALDRLRSGISLEEGKTAPCRAHLKESRDGGGVLEMTLHEGRKRQVKRMCAAIGHPVRHLTRTAFAGITARGLRPGRWRYLRTGEVEALRRRVGL